MPWKAKDPVDLRLDFVARVRAGERITDLCREFGISRKTGHKIWNRYEQLGIEGLRDQSRAPKHIPHRTPPELVEVLVAARQKHPTWGPKKLKQVLELQLGHELPAPSTIGSVLRQHGLVSHRKWRRRTPPRATRLTEGLAPNDVWCADYKGQFRLGDGSYCYPLTITDQFSRYLLACEGMARIEDEQAKEAFEDVFRSHGLPSIIRTDNGVPFASRGLAGLTRLSVYWMSLGIQHERTRPAHPEENGRHERMHRTLKRETTRPARDNLLQQQEVFDTFLDEFNTERPHEALDMRRPADVYVASARRYPERFDQPTYPLHDDTLTVTRSGQVRVPGRGTVYLSIALGGYDIGIREEVDGRWLVSFMSLELGHVEKDGSLTTNDAPPASR
jgi:transposase InsO family protein